MQLGRQVIVDAYHCNVQALDDTVRIENLLRDAAHATGAHVLKIHVHRFQPQGVTGLALVSTSHLAVHTWPEHGYAAIDIFTCGDNDPWPGVEVLLTGLSAGHAWGQEWPRGKGEAWQPSLEDLGSLARVFGTAQSCRAADSISDT